MLIIRPLSVALLALGLAAVQSRTTSASFESPTSYSSPETPPSLLPLRFQPADEQLPTRVKFRSGLAGFLFRQVVARAGRRLLDPSCDRILTDFRAEEGSSLAASLETAGQTPAQFLARLWWVDATDDGACRDNENLAAFTSPYDRVVHVCAARFADTSYALAGVQGEMIVIHEMLHALGLAENPPTSREITARVTMRCGGSFESGGLEAHPV
jgi:hypothetical protein